jgi:sugar transferase (PEP-CTERM system associated)
MIRMLKRTVNRRSLVLIVGEATIIAAAVVLGVWIRLGSNDTSWVFTAQQGYFKTAVVTAICLLCLYFSDLYNLRRVSEPGEMFVRLIQGLGAASIVLALVYFWFPSLMLGRGVFVLTSVLVIGALAAWRAAFTWLGRRLKARERLLLVGTGQAAVALAREMYQRRDELGVEIVGFIDPDPHKVGAAVLNPGVVGTIEDIPSIARARAVDRVVVSLADARGKLPMDKLLEMKLDGVSFDHLASVYEEYTGKIAIENLRPSWLIFSEGFHKGRWQEASKRALDIGVSLVALVVTLPLTLLIAVTVKLTSRGSVLYHQQRVGQHGRVFTVHKFRSMSENAEADTGPVWAVTNDHRVTPVGRFLRRARLDELPQLWNVLAGDMSLVGPRPERPEFVQQLTAKIPFYGQRHVLRPGLSGWAQVRYTYGASVEDALEKLQYDLFYIKHVSIAFDLFIIFATVKTVILSRGA